MKSIFVSKTFWVNVISGILGILSLPQVAQLPPSVLVYIGLITPLLNIILRRISDTPVIFKLPANIGKLIVIFALCGLPMAMSGCASAIPLNLSPQATTAFRNTQVIKGLDLLRDTAIAANAQQPPQVSEATTRLIVQYHESTLKVLNASTDGGWRSIASQGLVELTSKLPASEKALLGPYLSLASQLLKEIK